MLTLQEEILEEWEKKFADMLNLVETQTGVSERKRSKQFIISALKRQHQADMEEVKKWVEDNHEHHEWCEVEDRPHGVQGCENNDQPYVNSLKLVEFLSTLKGKV